MAHVDLCIIGGGCAGLSLARYLAQDQSSNCRVVVLEPRNSYQNDRSWCFWSAGAPDLSPMASHRWERWAVSDDTSRIVHSDPQNAYCHIPAGTFYQCALRDIHGSENVELKTGVSVTAVSEDDTGVLLCTSAGRLRAKWAVDTRPPIHRSFNKSVMFQVFLGAEIKTKRDTFDPTTVSLMEDIHTDNRGIFFTYVLPFSPNRALVEFTGLCREPLTPTSLEGDLSHVIDVVAKRSPYVALRHERAILPMGLPQIIDQPNHRVVTAGIAAGALRPSTGYGLVRINRWAALCAEAIAKTGRPTKQLPDPWTRRWMDAVFLRVIRNNPSIAPGVFTSMARGMTARSFASFLSDMATPSDVFRCVRSLPSMPFLRAAILGRVMAPA